MLGARTLLAALAVVLLASACSAGGRGTIAKTASEAATAASSSSTVLQLLDERRTTAAHAKTLLADMQKQVSDALTGLDELDLSTADDARFRADVRVAVVRTATLIASAREYVAGVPDSAPARLIGDLTANAHDLSALSEAAGP